MAKSKNKVNNGPSFNIGIIIFLIIFIYIIINIIIHLGKDSYSVVEVQKGKIVDNGHYTGIILRNEEVVISNDSGAINYYISNGGKVAKNSNVYMLDTAAQKQNGDATLSTNSLSDLTSSDYSNIKQIISLYTSNYSDSRYSDLYTFKYDLQNQINEAISGHNISTAQNNGSGQYVHAKAQNSGIVCYTYDGLESLTKEQITDDMFNATTYEKKQLTSNQWVDYGDPAYKLVTGDEWEIIIKLTQAQAKALSSKSYVSLKFSRDNIETSSRIEVFSNGESNYACLTLSKYMIRYISDRYIDIEIITSSAEGLKIPTSAVLEKDFYKIPVEYLVTDEDTYEEGFYTYSYDDNGELKALFYKATIYHNDGEYCYVSTQDFSINDYIGKLNSSDRYKIGTTGQLTGVYNINKGYAIFRLINILYSNDEYCIIQTNTPYGISLYDRIILNAGSVSEEQMIY